MAKKVQSDAPKTGVDRWREATHTELSVKPGSGKKHVSQTVARSRRTLITAAVLGVAAAAAVFVFRGSFDRGVDISGGTELVFTASGAGSSELSDAAKVLRTRLAGQGITGGEVKTGEGDQVLVQVPATDDPDSLASGIGQTGKLEFARVDEISDAEAMSKIQNGKEGVKLGDGSYTSFLDGSHVKSAQVRSASSSASRSSSSSNTYMVVVNFDSEGAQKFADVTKELASSNGQIAIVVDGEVKSAPAVQAVVDGGQVSISGNFSLEEALQLKSMLDSGTLPVGLSYDQSRPLDPVFSTSQLAACLVATLAVFAVAGLMLFGLFASVAVAAPALSCVLTSGALLLCSASGLFSLSVARVAAVGVALLCEFIAVGAVVFRLRSLVRDGRSVKSASIKCADSIVRPAGIALAALIVVAFVLLFVPSGDVQAVALALACGLACDAASSLLVVVPVLRLAGQGAASAKPGLWGLGRAVAQANGPEAGDDASGRDDGSARNGD